MVAANASNAAGEEDEQEAALSVAAANEIHLQLLGDNICEKTRGGEVFLSGQDCFTLTPTCFHKR